MELDKLPIDCIFILSIEWLVGRSEPATRIDWRKVTVMATKSAASLVNVSYSITTTVVVQGTPAQHRAIGTNPDLLNRIIRDAKPVPVVSMSPIQWVGPDHTVVQAIVTPAETEAAAKLPPISLKVRGKAEPLVL